MYRLDIGLQFNIIISQSLCSIDIPNSSIKSMRIEVKTGGFNMVYNMEIKPFNHEHISTIIFLMIIDGKVLHSVFHTIPKINALFSTENEAMKFKIRNLL